MGSINKYLNFYGTNSLPIIHQSESSECGLACLVMIAAYYGHKIDLTTARSKFNVSLKGLTLNDLVNIAERMELQARPLRAELDALQFLKLPVILHWDLCHFVVLKKIYKDKMTIHDPGRGQLTLSMSEVSNHYTGVALELTPSPDFKEKDEVKPVKINTFWTRIHGLKSNLVQIFLLSLFLQVFVVTGPLFQQLVVDNAITKQDVDLLLVLSMGFVLIGMFQTTISYVRAKVILYFTNVLSFQMTANLFRHLIRLPLSYFEKRQIGDITTRFGSLGPIQTLISSSVIAVVLDGLLAIASLAMSLTYSVPLTMLVLFLLFLNFLIQWVTFPYQKNNTEKIIELSAKESSVFLENIQTATTIKIFGQEAVRENIWLNRKADQMNASISLANFNISFGAATSILSTIQSVVLMYLGAQLVIEGKFTLGMLFAFQSYSGQFSGKASAIISQYMSFKMLDLHLQRLADIVHEKSEVGNSEYKNDYKMDCCGEDITFNNVSFRYADGEPWVLKNINLKINKGEMIAIKGPSGEGKSTLLKLILGLLSPNEGTIHIGNKDLSTIDPVSYRKNIGVVMQNDKLLSGTIAENICFFDPEINYAQIENCTKIACLDKDVERNPMKYHTLVGEMGSTLSGGQKQRLFLARALYRNPSMLFLDEGTANLDLETESQIAETVRNMEITRIIIAHRPALINIADRIFELKNTNIIEIEKNEYLQVKTNEII